MYAAVCTNLVLYSDYSEVKTIGADAVYFTLISLCPAGNIVVTQDYDVATMALGKRLMRYIKAGNDIRNI